MMINLLQVVVTKIFHPITMNYVCENFLLCNKKLTFLTKIEILRVT